MNSTQLPSLKHLNECFLYDRNTGSLRWRQRPERHFTNERVAKMWNTKYAGKEAFHEDPKRGYRSGTLDGQSLYAHRVIWKLVTKEDPPKVIDHKDRNTRNNRWNNFRAATHVQNAINSEKANGVIFDASRGKWMAYTKIKGRVFTIGRFSSREEAVAARYGALRVLHKDFVP